MRLQWNSHPNYRATIPKIVHCSYKKMQLRIEVMRELAKNPGYNYPKFSATDTEENENELPS